MFTKCRLARLDTNEHWLLIMIVKSTRTSTEQISPFCTVCAINARKKAINEHAVLFKFMCQLSVSCKASRVRISYERSINTTEVSCKTRKIFSCSYISRRFPKSCLISSQTVRGSSERDRPPTVDGLFCSSVLTA